MAKRTRKEIPLQYVIAVYADLLDEIWQRVADLIGGITLQVLMNTAVRRVSAAYPFITAITVTVDGVSLDKLEEIGRDQPSHQVKEALQNLITELFSILAAMSGDVIIRELAPKVREAETRLCQITENGEQ